MRSCHERPSRASPGSALALAIRAKQHSLSPAAGRVGHVHGGARARRVGRVHCAECLSAGVHVLRGREMLSTTAVPCSPSYRILRPVRPPRVVGATVPIRSTPGANYHRGRTPTSVNQWPRLRSRCVGACFFENGTRGAGTPSQMAFACRAEQHSPARPARRLVLFQRASRGVASGALARRPLRVSGFGPA